MCATKLLCFLLTLHFAQSNVHNCYIKSKPEYAITKHEFIKSHTDNFQEFLCNLGYDICCPEGCCTSSQSKFYPYLWEILITALLIFVFVLVCVCGCYYCKNNFDKTSTSVEPSSVDVSVNEFTPSAPVANNRTPPPAYDIAILLPPVHPQDRVPSYEEVTTKRF
ncbi:hypothetical protein Zmor_000416 [Zophobas morio]|uniref:CX domain-containing protein n=1 Tax=Zophobas morio TaxID=2755281 RepID=A0AA38MNJ1_9CUCU|nr:hypothetical protein Zmor_000416 [Zophobas morio]